MFRYEAGTCATVADTLKGVNEFLEHVSSAHAESTRLCESALSRALKEWEAELDVLSENIHALALESGRGLLPRVSAGDPLPLDALNALNTGIRECESKLGDPQSQSDVIPTQLLACNAGGKLYVNLGKKVVALCDRTLNTWSDILRTRLSNNILKGGVHPGFDAADAKISGERAEFFQRLCCQYSDVLARSDHFPIYETVPCKSSVIVIASWNVLEFPRLSGVESAFFSSCGRHVAPGLKPVIDGVQPHCCRLLTGLSRSSKELPWLLDAMCSRTVIQKHSDQVLEWLRSTLEGVCSIVTLQEVSQDMKERIRSEADLKGWWTHFSACAGAAGKCDAITAIISRLALEDPTEFVCEANKKVRQFAAARLDDTWIVSVHIPHAKYGACNEDMASAVLARVSTQFLRDGNSVICAGDWNADVRIVSRASRGQLFAPSGETQFMTRHTIDGVIKLS